MRRILTGLIVVAFAAAASVPLATAAPSLGGGGGEDSGLAERIGVNGLCRGEARYHVVLRNKRSSGDLYVIADLTIQGAGDRTRWSFFTEASTEFADGTGVTGNRDGVTRSSRKGIIRIGAGTPAGVDHEFRFGVGRYNGSDYCYVRVAA